VGRPPSPGEPDHPLFRDDPDHVWQVAAALAAALLDSEQPKPGRLLEGVLNHPATDSGPRRDLIDASGAMAVLADLIPDDAQDRQLAHRELAGQRRRYWTRGGEVAATSNRDGALRGSLGSPGWED